MDIEFSEIGLIPSTRPSRRHQEQFVLQTKSQHGRAEELI